MIPWKAYRYAQYARELGWTPLQVDREVPLYVDKVLFRILAAINSEATARAQKAQEAQKRQVEQR